MAERTDQRTRDRDTSADLDLGLDDETDGTTDLSSGFGIEQESSVESDSSGGIRGRISERLDSIFSIESFGITLLVTVVMAFVAGAFIPFVPDNVSGLLGVFGAGFALGAASSDRHYLEVAAATLLAGAITALLSSLKLTLLGMGMPLIALGAGASGVAGVAGYYFGRDLRTGLSKEI
jgi:hypothetical protein